MTMLRQLRNVIAPACGLALLFAIGGCSSTAIEDHLPTALGGLPANAPARPAVAPEFLPVHDMPPNREVKPLSEPERKKLEAELNSVRTRQEQLNPNAKPAPSSQASQSAAPNAKPDTR